MNNLFIIITYLITSILPTAEIKTQKVDICNAYGSIYIETQNRNVADFSVYVDNEGPFVDLKVYVQDNQFYADKAGMWYFTKDRSLADYIVFVEKEEGRARYKIQYIDTESYAGCR